MVEKKIKQPSMKELADAIRKFPDQDLVALYNLAINQLQTIALGYKAKLVNNLKEGDE